MAPTTTEHGIVVLSLTVMALLAKKNSPGRLMNRCYMMMGPFTPRRQVRLPVTPSLKKGSSGTNELIRRFGPAHRTESVDTASIFDNS